MLKPVIRSFAFLSNWVAWVVRQPAMLLTMILGPFIILGLFALSNAASGQRPRTIVVRPAAAPAQAQISDKTLGVYFDVVGDTQDVNQARDQLRQGKADVALVLPANPRAELAQGKQATITVLTNQIDPISLAFLRADLRAAIAELNKEVQRQGVEQTKAEAAATNQHFSASLALLNKIDQDANNPQAVRTDVHDLDAELGPALDSVPALAAAAEASTILLPAQEAQQVAQQASAAQQTALAARATLAALRAEADSPQPSPTRIRSLAQTLRGQITTLQGQVGVVQKIPTTTVVQPFEGTVEEIAPYVPTLITFYAPAALALLLQHFAVTLAALSMVRARFLGMVEFWRIAPIRASEIISGNYLSYGIISIVAWVLLTAAVVYLLGVPVLGPLSFLVGSAVLLILASLGIGFVISLLASNEQQAAQLAMLVLLGSVFLSGFVRPLESIDYPVRFVSYLLPATFGIELFQDIMLRGMPGQIYYMSALAALAFVGFLFALVLFRRELRPT